MDKFTVSSYKAAALIGVGAALGYGLCSGINAIKASHKGDKLELPVFKKHEKAVNEKVNIEKSKELLQEQLIRNIQFFGEAGQEKISNSYVIVFGVGGVGSHVVSSLARSGVSHIKVVDFDQVSLSSLNRHAFALQEDVGRSKVQCIADYVRRIIPSTQVETVEDYVTKDNVSSFFLGDIEPTYVVDCIDNIEAKVALLAYCRKNNKRVISSMGAGMKADPTRLQIRDISETNYDDLSRAVRQKLKKYHVTDGIKVVLSVERSERELLPLKDHQEANPDEYKVFSNYRLRIVPVLGTMPALVAYALSSYVLCDIAEQLYKPFTVDEVKQANYAKIYNQLTTEAKKAGIASEDYQFDMEDVYILVREIFDWTDIINGKKVCGGLLVRWNPELEFVAENMVMLNFQDGKKHHNFKTFAEVQATYSVEIFEKVQAKLEKYRSFIAKKPVIYK